MKNLLVNYGVIALFYLVVVLGALYLCSGNAHHNVNNNSFSTSVVNTK